MKFDDNATKMLNIMPEIEVVEAEIVEDNLPVKVEPTKPVDDDYDYARKNIKDVIEVGQQSLAELATLADQSESPRAYEVLANIMKTMIEGNKELLNIKKTSLDIREPSAPKDDAKNVTNNLIITTTDLQRKLDEMNKQ